MKKFMQYLLILSIIQTGCIKSKKTIYGPNDLSGNWNILINLPDINTYQSIFFINRNTGWVAGHSGKIMYTRNGGISWEYQNSGTNEDLFDIYFNNSEKGWIIGSKNTVLSTSNKGINWNKILIDQDTSQMFSSIQFTDDDNGWIISNHGKLFNTKDSGKTWGVQLTWENGGSGLIHFVNNSIGFVLPARFERQLFETSDGGLRWLTKEINIDISRERDMFFIDQYHGWICNDRSASSQSEDYASIFHTKNGGTTWELLHRFDEKYLNKIYFIDNNNGWVAGRKIYYTFNGGNTWLCQINDNNTFFTDLQFINSSIGYALDYGGRIYKYQSN